MPTTTDVRVNDLIINKMTQEQYDALQEKSPTELYVVEGDSNVAYAEQAVELPTASENNLGKIYQYVGVTDANYTNGYFYKCVSDGLDPATYSWQQVDVQPAIDPLPSQSGNAGKFLKTDGTDTSWENALVNNTTYNGSTAINGASFGMYNVSVGGSVGHYYSGGNATCGVALGNGTQVDGNGAIAIGHNAFALANNAIQIAANTSPSSQANSDANTFKVGNANGNFEIMSADGTIPEARLADTTSATTGQVLQLDSNNNAVWADVDSLPSQSGQTGKILGTDGTNAAWETKTTVSFRTWGINE